MSVIENSVSPGGTVVGLSYPSAPLRLVRTLVSEIFLAASEVLRCFRWRAHHSLGHSPGSEATCICGLIHMPR